MTYSLFELLTTRKQRVLIGLFLVVALLVLAGDPVAGAEVADPFGDVYIGP